MEAKKLADVQSHIILPNPLIHILVYLSIKGGKDRKLSKIHIALHLARKQ